MKPVQLIARLAVVAFLCSTVAFGANRQWQHGKLVDTEQQKEKSGSTTFSQNSGDVKAKGNKGKYSESGTSTTSDDIDTFEVYTIQGPEKTYIAREKLLFPWSKSAHVTVGDQVKYAIDGRKLYILDEDGKEHKASIIKTSLNAAR